MNRKRIIIILIALALIIPIVIASNFTCSGNTCTGSDTVTFSDNPSLHSSLLPPFKDMFTVSDKAIEFSKMFKFIDKVVFSDIASLVQNAIVTITITVTNTVTSISNGCTGSSCFVNPGGNNTEQFAELLVAPLAFIVITAFCFMYVGLRFFGVIVMVTTFIILGLAYIGIIPSYFTLLTIIMIGGAITKLISTMIGDRN